jgi:hypothetical protein
MLVSGPSKYTNKKDKKQTNIQAKFSTSTYRVRASKIFVCLSVFFEDKEKPPKKDQKTPEPHPVGFRPTWGTPEGKKRGFLREDISPPYSALEESKTTKSASGKEKKDPVYIMKFIRSPWKPALNQETRPYPVLLGTIHRKIGKFPCDGMCRRVKPRDAELRGHPPKP